MATTAYIILELRQGTDGVTGNEWTEVGTYTAASAGAAQSAAAVEHGDGTYVATPARGWKPTAFKVQPRAVKS